MKNDRSASRKAAAIRYDQMQDQAPTVIAKGRGLMAEKIIRLAREHDIPLVCDADLAQVLEALELHSQIPPQLYRAVAEVLVFVYRLNQKAAPKAPQDT
jgi:flagellar biosynthesis protein